ncbi:hypothetical protein D041_0640A, partial [Vibrio parahaemolyticus EKP-008]
MRSSLYALTS